MFVKIVQNSHETLVLESLSNDDAGLQLYQKETPTKVLSSEFPEMLKKMFFTEHLRTTPYFWKNNISMFDKIF